MANGNLRPGTLRSVPGGGQLRSDAAIAYTALNRFCLKEYGRGLQNAGGGATYRRVGRPGDYARGGEFTQWFAWERYQHGGNLAARPGYSNHGLGIACDFVSIDLVRDHGARFGWKKTEAFGEAWHYCYVPGNYSAVKRWSNVPAGETIRPGDRGTGVTAAKRLLKRCGYWRWPSVGAGYSRTFGRAIRRFQRDNGEVADGIIGKHTWKLLRGRAK